MIDIHTLRKIKKLGIETDWNDAFDGKSKGNRHLFRVVKLATFMAKRLGANISITEAGAWLHDTALPSGNDYDYERNKEIVKSLLTGFSLSPIDSDMIAECVASHEGTSTPKLLEAKIVHDADVLEKSGLLGIIRHTWKLANSGKISSESITKRDIAGILNHLKWRSRRLQMPLSKEIHSYLTVPITPGKVREIVTLVAEKAVSGLVTEKIAELIYKKLNKRQQKILKEQLNLAYLARLKHTRQL